VALARYRRPLAAALLAVAVATGVHAARPASAATRAVLVASRDLRPGHRLTALDVVERRWPAGDVPVGAVTKPLGRVLGSPVRRGEPLTDVRFLAAGSGGSGSGGSGSGRSGSGKAGRGDPPGDLVAVTVRLTDAASALVARTGEAVDVIAGPATDPLSGAPPVGSAAGAGGGSASIVVRDALVLAAPSAGSSAGWPAENGGASADSTTDSSAADTPGGSGAGTTGRGLRESLTGPALPDDGSRSDGSGASRLPTGVLVVAVTSGEALQLAAVAGVRTLSVARHTATST